ncbi:IS701 family transposase [Mesorhizobium silamurunense]|uniref:IS701 family transposase n=1 Tax=Mesorhizobium silamurunense TaxID=499528 RepID=UPI001FEAB1D5|nr:IS701 family transposase [Mesorhizobium silamurunense]
MPDWTAESEAAFDAYVDALIGVIGHADRAEPLKDYCLGLLMPMERKSVEPLAAVTAPSRVAAKHQSLLHFVGQAPWSDAALLARVRDWVLPRIEQRGPIRAWIVDDTGFPKKGKHSVGVARQYCGQLGKQDNCQIAVSLSIANDAASLPIAYELYLPHSWAQDPEQRKKAKIPAEITFRTKPQIALEQIRTAKAEGVAPGVVLADAGYGADGGFRAGLSELDLTYVVGVQPTLSVWRPGESPLPPKPWSGRGRPPSRVGRTDNHKPISAKALAEEFDAETWRTIAWREGTNTELNSRFAAVRLRPASRDYNRPEAHAEEWLLIEWPEGEVEPSKYWLSTLPADATITQLVDAAKLRWRIERDYQELKQELGLGHYEGRGWRGFHHHASLCIAAYGFLVSLRETIPPSTPTRAQGRQTPGLPNGYRPRGSSDPTRAARSDLDPNPQATPDCGPGQPSATMSVLHKANGQSPSGSQFMTQ